MPPAEAWRSRRLGWLRSVLLSVGLVTCVLLVSSAAKPIVWERGQMVSPRWHLVVTEIVDPWLYPGMVLTFPVAEESILFPLFFLTGNVLFYTLVIQLLTSVVTRRLGNCQPRRVVRALPSSASGGSAPSPDDGGRAVARDARGPG